MGRAAEAVIAELKEYYTRRDLHGDVYLRAMYAAGGISSELGTARYLLELAAEDDARGVVNDEVLLSAIADCMGEAVNEITDVCRILRNYASARQITDDD